MTHSFRTRQFLWCVCERELAHPLKVCLNVKHTWREWGAGSPVITQGHIKAGEDNDSNRNNIAKLSKYAIALNFCDFYF